MQPSSQPLLLPSHQPFTPPTSHPSGSKQHSPVPTVSPDKTTYNSYVGILSHQDPNSCEALHSFVIYPVSTCLVMKNTHPDGTAFISGHTKYSCGTNGASVMSYLPADTTCSQEPYDIYPLPNYGKCPADAELEMYTCLSASSVATLSKSVRGVVKT